MKTQSLGSCGQSLPQIPAEDHQTIHAAMQLADDAWALYPIHAVDAHGVCTCPKGVGCEDPGKHPMTRGGFGDASSDPERIAELFSNRPGANVGLRAGKGSGVVVLDIDPRHGGMETLEHLQAEHGPLPATRLHATGGGGYHYALGYPEDAEHVPNRTLGPGVELKADGAAVVLPPSNHAAGGVYGVLMHGEQAPVPAWVLELAHKPDLEALEGGNEPEPTRSRFKIPARITEGARNDTLYSYGCSLRAHGHEHTAILSELRRVNEDRCAPPLDDGEVYKIATSASGHDKGNASTVSPEALEAVAFLGDKAWRRPRKGTAAHSRWAVYMALLDCAWSHGWRHGRDVAVRISVRQLTEDAGITRRTTQRALVTLYDAGLVHRLSSGEGLIPGVLALRVPRRGSPDTTHTTPPPVSTGVITPPSGGEGLHRLRHGYSLGKLHGGILREVVESPGITRKEIGCRLGRTGESLKDALRRLRDLGLVENPVRGRYRPASDWRRVLDRERTMTGEKKAERLQEAKHECEREAYRYHLEEQHREYAELAQDVETEEPVTPDPAESVPAREPEDLEDAVRRLSHEGMQEDLARAEASGDELEIDRALPQLGLPRSLPGVMQGHTENGGRERGF
jgi:putative DNA primase/helicase